MLTKRSFNRRFFFETQGFGGRADSAVTSLAGLGAFATQRQTRFRGKGAGKAALEWHTDKQLGMNYRPCRQASQRAA